MVSILNNKQGYEFPKPIKLNKTIKDMLEREVNEEYYVDNKLDIRNNKVIISQATKKGYIEMNADGVCDLSYPNSKTRRGRVQEGGNVCPTLTATKQDIVHIDKSFRVRKLTPLECWRLMSFTDEDFYKAKEAGISNSQLYKQAGNSIVVKVLEGIFENLFM